MGAWDLTVGQSSWGPVWLAAPVARNVQYVMQMHLNSSSLTGIVNSAVVGSSEDVGGALAGSSDGTGFGGPTGTTFIATGAVTTPTNYFGGWVSEVLQFNAATNLTDYLWARASILTACDSTGGTTDSGATTMTSAAAGGGTPTREDTMPVTSTDHHFVFLQPLGEIIIQVVCEADEVYWGPTGDPELSVVYLVDSKKEVKVSASAAWTGGGSVTVTADEYSGKIKYTFVKANLKALEFTSDHEDAAGDNLLRRSDADLYGDCGPQFEEPEWEPTGYTNPISHTCNTKVSLKATVYVSPSGLDFRLVGDGPNAYLDFTSGMIEATGADKDVAIEAAAPLPNEVCLLENKKIEWHLLLGNPVHTDHNLGESGGTYGHKIFVTLGTPDNAWTYASIPVGGTTVGYSYPTEKRMALLCRAYGTDGICGGMDDTQECAAAIQLWLPDNGGIKHNDPYVSFPVYADETWGLLGEENNMKGQCWQYAELHEMMLRLLGVSAEMRSLKATKSLAPLEGRTYQIRYEAAATLSSPRSQKYNDGTNELWLDYGAPNHGEGSVRVGDRVYTEWAGLVVGQDSGDRTAEHHALFLIPTALDPPKTLATFQRYINGLSLPSGGDLWAPGPVYEPIPAFP